MVDSAVIRRLDGGGRLLLKNINTSKSLAVILAVVLCALDGSKVLRSSQGHV
jgi:hypothetical protein